jgi:hypothetical protein
MCAEETRKKILTADERGWTQMMRAGRRNEERVSTFGFSVFAYGEAGT